MSPVLRPGDRLLVDYRAQVRPGRVVLARFPDGELVVKRAAYAVETFSGADGWYLLGDNPEQSVDSRHRGPVPSERLLGVVRARVWPPGRRPPPGS